MRSNSTAYTPQNPEIFHKGHIHFFDLLSSFHGLEDQPDYPVQQQTIQDKLRHQYLHDNNWEDKLCYRTCFKIQEKEYVQFCLNKKCSGAPYLKAAQVLGYVKSGNPTPKAHGHHHH
ncbi:unnamed protein product (macronuclear) [Paramecium tetraurelia]|uniref:Uncharacterized protein n=1 Tax=Paramecium tetraurelia TaxID=5888 RepID=A0D920_PARTE|nr:uncharacterized protein GSPATT00014483001 [Paramecium tetraurelia]CAK79537.1 unnamed protein product [Paramecium tetraurelia]|eukprot:XP_001446934.1 hypothetical protein (macronuclear) [Paramecium tetraurelia strain d4-2]